MDGRLVTRILLLIVIFFGTIFVVNRINNAGVNEVSAEMEQATIPVMYVRYEDRLINVLHGYTGKVDTTYFRDTITPMDYGQTIEIWGNQGEEYFSRYEYELRSMYQGDLIENGEVTESVYEDGYDKISVTFRTKLEELSEYVLVIKAMQDQDTVVRYYTRVVVENDFHASTLLDFVERFNNAIFDKQEAEKVISKSIEPNEEGNNEYLSEVTIHSSFETITFANLSPMRITKPIASIKEIDDSYAIIQLKYLISATEEKILENYYVTEDYRVRFVDESNVYLLDYNRTQEEVFTMDNINISSNQFKIGIIQDRNYQYITSDNQKKIAFVQAKQLWYYDYAEGKIIKIFGFCNEDNYTDPRATYDDHNIRILKMSNDADITFAVYGYMNSGEHEGKVGMSVFRFQASKNKVDELLFIENDKPFNILKDDMEKLMYLNENDEFFYFDHDCVVRVNVGEMISEIYIEDILNENLAVSDDNHLIGYPDALLTEETNKVTVLDLESQRSFDIMAKSGEHLRAIGFVQDDLVLGRISESDIVVALDKTVTCPIFMIDLIDQNHQIVKTYGDSELFVLNATADKGVVYLERAKRVGDNFEEAPQDFITYKEDEDPDKIVTTYKFSDDVYNQLYLVFPAYMYIGEKPKPMITKETVSDLNITVKVSFDHVNPKYYAFGQGHYMKYYLNLNTAVRTAYENAGVVTDDNGIILWRKIAVKDYHTVASKVNLYHVDEIDETLAACIYMMGVYEEKNPDYIAMKEDLNNETPIEDVIFKYTGRQGTDITGCDFENGLYYLCKDAPVITRFEDGTYVLVTSYNGEKIRYINPLDETDTVDPREEFEKRVLESGNVFISYVR